MRFTLCGGGGADVVHLGNLVKYHGLWIEKMQRWVNGEGERDKLIQVAVRKVIFTSNFFLW